MENKLDRIAWEAAVAADAGGWASDAERVALGADPLRWAAALRLLIHETDDALRAAASIAGEERQQVLSDLDEERQRLSAALLRVAGDTIDLPALGPAGGNGAGPHHNSAAGAETAASADGAAPEESEPGSCLLQASWGEGRVVVWAGGPGAVPGPDDLDELLAKADAAGIGWERHASVATPGGQCDALSAPLSQTLGWLVGIGGGDVREGVAPSLRWMGEVALWGTELVAQGRMVPVIRGTSSGGASATKPTGSRHRVRWVPALISRERLHGLVTRMPGAVGAVQTGLQSDAVCRSLLAAVVDAVSRAGAGRLVAPAAAPHSRTRAEIAEAVLSGLDGRPFVADAEPASRVGEDLKRWAAPVTANHRVGLLVRLDPPEFDGGWQLSVEATGVDKHPMPVEHALVVASGTKSQQVEAQLRRLERLIPALRRPSTRRGQVVLDGDEAVELMFNIGQALGPAGFDVMLPKVSARRPSPQLRLYADAIGGPSQVGVQQLANVRWSVFFDDVELDAAGIAALAREAQPLVKVRGRWVHIDRADLAAAAAALAERSSITQLSGAAVIRQAIGLEGTALGGAVRVDGSGWAADLLRGATTHAPAPIDTPDGFNGQLRSYQAEAASWLGFLDRAGLGGCLAMDMGLGKTPTLLAHLLVDHGHGPTLVICPPAVLGNWAEEAARFTRGLKVSMHHGPRRAEGESIGRLAATSDVVLTTYATAVRDIDALSAITWRRVVVDEAQVIKNHQSETARELRRLQAHSRIALTGTPVENGLGDLWAILDFTNPGLVGPRNAFIEKLSRNTDASVAPVPQAGSAARASEENALRALNGLLIFRRTKNEPEIAAELPDKVDKLDHCSMTAEQIGLYQAVIDRLIAGGLDGDSNARKGQVLAAITALKQICDHPAAYLGAEDEQDTLVARSGKLARLEELVHDVFAAGERILIFTHFARWGERMATHLSERTGVKIGCYHGGLSRTVRDSLITKFQEGTGPGALVLSIKAGGSGLNLTAANHVVLYDRWWNPAVEDQARDRAWRIGQDKTVMCHRLVCPGTVDERVEEIVAGKRRVAGMVLPARSSLGDLDAAQLRSVLGLREDQLVEEESTDESGEEVAA
ncbi:MAG TPA: SNF2-related protein [Acidimicrobiales bacterium]|nr:SNF2-related protein [Acidimicrobiales bacterium]